MEPAAEQAMEAVAGMESTANQAVETVVELMSTWGLQVLGALAVLIIGRILCGWARKSVRRALENRRMDPSLVPFISNLVYYTLLVALLIAVLGIFGIETTSLIAVLGAAGLAVGLALQGTLSNFSAGVMLLIFRPFRVGDFVDVAGSAGTVAEVGLFSTTMNSPDNVRIIIPNSTIFGDIIKNFSANETRRNDIVLGVSYSDDLGRAIETVHAVLAKDERVLKDPAPTVAVAELADSSVNLVVRPWCNGGDYWPLRFDLVRRLKEEIEQAGCSIPFPQHDVHVHRTNGSG
jgi:small conductance mechanosensitive channel